MDNVVDQSRSLFCWMFQEKSGLLEFEFCTTQKWFHRVCVAKIELIGTILSGWTLAVFSDKVTIVSFSRLPWKYWGGGKDVTAHGGGTFSQKSHARTWLLAHLPWSFSLCWDSELALVQRRCKKRVDPADNDGFRAWTVYAEGRCNLHKAIHTCVSSAFVCSRSRDQWRCLLWTVLSFVLWSHCKEKASVGESSDACNGCCGQNWRLT